MSTNDNFKLLRAFGQIVRERRTELGISQEAFAHQAGLHRTYVSGIERGLRNTALVNLFRIAEALELTPQELIGRINSLLAVSQNK